jgi:hypothetical protein
MLDYELMRGLSSSKRNCLGFQKLKVVGLEGYEKERKRQNALSKSKIQLTYTWVKKQNYMR